MPRMQNGNDRIRADRPSNGLFFVSFRLRYDPLLIAGEVGVEVSCVVLRGEIVI